MAPIVDIHTHLYPPAFIKLLESRQEVPLIRRIPGSDIARLVILPGEDDANKAIEERGRPLGPDYWDIQRKISFMDQHQIDVSVVSLANPWLDFLPPTAAAETAKYVNNDLEQSCAKFPGRLYAFGTLPLSANTEDIVSEIRRLKGLRHMRGVIMGTSGLGNGLDDPNLDSLWAAVESTATTVFLHPHYGLPSEVYGPRGGEYGHVLPLALGFPLETTIAVTRMYLSGVFDRYPGLSVLLAHSGGTLPFLAGRIESCIAHDSYLNAHNKHMRRSIWQVLTTNIYLDAVIYSEAGLKAAAHASGSNRILFGKFEVTCQVDVRSQLHVCQSSCNRYRHRSSVFPTTRSFRKAMEERFIKQQSHCGIYCRRC